MAQRRSNSNEIKEETQQISEQEVRVNNLGSYTRPQIEVQRLQTEIQIEVTDPIENKGKSNENTVEAPEKKLTLFALRLAVLEKMATGLGTLGFIWATVVLLGGFAVTLHKIDFWFITIILVIEGTRIFSRSHELEWQHQVTWSLRDAGISSFRALKSSSHHLMESITSICQPISATRPESMQDVPILPYAKWARKYARCIIINKISTLRAKLNQNYKRKPTRAWVTSDVPILPYAKWAFLSKNVSKFLYWLQLLSASTCVVLSLMRLIKQQFGDGIKDESSKRNLNAALNIFYSLALAEALLFLMEKIYWEWTVMYLKLLEEVNKECGFGPPGMIAIKRFFYDAYSRCVTGSIFDGLKMDLVSFAMELLNSDSNDEQLIGARILRKFATTERFSNDTLQKIEISLLVMERLVDMLSWKDPQEREIRHSAALILSILAGKDQNSLRVAAIPGAMESISSLLTTSKSSTGATADGICHGNINHDQEHYAFSAFNNLGLLILRELARDHDNCGKIGNTRALLPNLIYFIKTGEKFLKGDHEESQILTVERSLQVVKLLANTKGSTGKILRQEITEVVYTISNIRDILRYGEKYSSLQKLGIEILTSLALEDDGTERIGSTGGIIKNLFDIFFEPGTENSVRDAAGEALAMLAYESESNCHRILKLEVVEKLVFALIARPSEDTTRIIRCLVAYSSSDCLIQLRGITAAVPTVLRVIMSSSEGSQLQEVMFGLAAQMFRFMSFTELGIACENFGIIEGELATQLVETLKKFKYPMIGVPRIRRFLIELAIWMMRYKRANIQIFKNNGLKEQLESVTETTSDVESFNVFTGTIGLSRHSTTMNTLVATALELLMTESPDKQY